MPAIHALSLDTCLELGDLPVTVGQPSHTQFCEGLAAHFDVGDSWPVGAFKARDTEGEWELQACREGRCVAELPMAGEEAQSDPVGQAVLPAQRCGSFRA